MFGCALPMRVGVLFPISWLLAWLASMATCTSNSAASMWRPLPVRARSCSAASMAVVA
ncbi:hypothetical protein Y695_04578 [Hydrogenophaga sp. T4]|nr:hypothetical protein Y695_04578 [Hydrogenophaga sp. T4]